MYKYKVKKAGFMTQKKGKMQDDLGPPVQEFHLVACMELGDSEYYIKDGNTKSSNLQDKTASWEKLFPDEVLLSSAFVYG